MKKMRKKIAILLLALCATATVNAQEMVPINPQMASKFSQATCAADICGVYTWTYKTASRRTAQPDTLTAGGSALTEVSKSVMISLLDAEKDSVLVWGIYDEPLHAFVSIQQGYYPSIRIPRDQYVGESATYGALKLNASYYRVDNKQGPYTASYIPFTVYSDRIENPTSSYLYWMNQMIVAGQYAGYNLSPYILPGSLMVEDETYKDYNGVMNIKYKRSITNRAGVSYPVNIEQNGNIVSVQNFMGSGHTVNINLHADNSLEIERQIGTTLSDKDYYTTAADYSSGTNVTVEGAIEGTGDEEMLTWGNWKLVSEDNYWTGAIDNGTISYLNDQFHFPVALTISDAGIASFSSEKNVDFSQATKLGDTPETVALSPNVVTDFTAQKATLEALDAPIPANYGVFVKGEAGDYEVPTVAEAATPNIVNNLQPTSNQEVQGDGSTIYALGLKDGKPGVMLVTAGTTIAANKAYLEGNFGSGAKFISFDGETTSIDGVELSADEAAPAYNLQGQRVGQNYRGIVVKNGKKSVVR